MFADTSTHGGLVEGPTTGYLGANDPSGLIGEGALVIAQVAQLQSQINSKADAAQTTAALATKSDAAQTTAALGTKADAAATTAALGTKADAAATTTALGTKADAAATTPKPTQQKRQRHWGQRHLFSNCPMA